MKKLSYLLVGVCALSMTSAWAMDDAELENLPAAAAPQRPVDNDFLNEERVSHVTDEQGAIIKTVTCYPDGRKVDHYPHPDGGLSRLIHFNKDGKVFEDVSITRLPDGTYWAITRNKRFERSEGPCNKHGDLFPHPFFMQSNDSWFN